MEKAQESAKQDKRSGGRTGATAEIEAPRHPMLELQQQAGNQAMLGLLRSGALRAKLTVSQPDDPEEKEADHVADRIMRSRAGAGWAASAEEEENGTSSPPAISRSASGPAARNASTNPAVQALGSSPGSALDASTRSFFEPRLGRDLSGVRVHTDSRAADSARSLRANAYATGPHLVFAPGLYNPQSESGTRLLAHELTHVVQQGAAPALPGHAPGGFSTARADIQRDDDPNAPPAEKKEEEPKDLGWMTEASVTLISGPAVAMGTTAYSLVHHMWHGFFAEIQGRGGEIVDKAKSRAREFITSPSQLAMFFPKYWWGLIKGIFSPITGLFDLAKLAFKMEDISEQLLASAIKKRAELSAAAVRIGASMRAMAGHAVDSVKDVLSHPLDSAMALGPLLDAVGKKADIAAESGGHTMAGQLISAADQPITDLAETAGEAIGTVLVNVVLFIFTEGIGDAVVQIAGKLGEVGAWLGKFGKVAEMTGALVTKLSEIVGTAGEVISGFEELLGKLAGALLKPLEPLLRDVGELMSGVRTFLRDLLGVSETAEEELLADTAKAAAHDPGTPPDSVPDGKTPEINSPNATAAAPKSAAEEVLDDTGLWAEEMDYMEAREELRKWVELDKTREVGMFRDPATGECIVVQGDPGKVPIDEIMDTPGLKDRRWELIEHYHPGEDEFARFASTGDFEYMMHGHDLTKPISTEIRWINEEGAYKFTTIGYEPGPGGPPGRYFIRYEDTDGIIAEIPLNDDPWAPGSDYRAFAEQRGFKPDGSTAGGPAKPIPGSGAPPTVTAGPNARLDPRTAQTGGIHSIETERDALGQKTTTIEGDLLEGMDRKTAPNFNTEWKRADLENYVCSCLQQNRGMSPADAAAAAKTFAENYEAAHLWGPGFGDEAAAGMLFAPRGVNQEVQNRLVEHWLRDAQKFAAGRGGTVSVTAKAIAWSPQELQSVGLRGNEFFLEQARYDAVITIPPNPPLQMGVTIHADLPGPNAGSELVFDNKDIAENFMKYFGQK